MIIDKNVFEEPSAANLAKSGKKDLIEMISKASEEVKKYSTPYILYYKAVHNVGQLNFLGPAELQEAISLGQKYCRDRNWRWIQVRPMFNDIEQLPQTEEERERFAREKSK